MDFKSMLQQLSQLSEGTQETEKGRVHKAEPGGYGRKFDTDEEGDEDKKGEKKEPAVKRGRGRPKKGADSETGQVAKYDNAKGLQDFMVGNLPKDKKGKPALPGKPSKKHSLKEWVQEIENKYVAEAEQISIKPASQMPKQPGQSSVPGQPQQVAGQPKKDTQVIAQGNMTLGTVDNPQLASQIKQSIGKGEMTLNQPLGEEGEIVGSQPNYNSLPMVQRALINALDKKDENTIRSIVFDHPDAAKAVISYISKGGANIQLPQVRQRYIDAIKKHMGAEPVNELSSALLYRAKSAAVDRRDAAQQSLPKVIGKDGYDVVHPKSKDAYDNMGKYWNGRRDKFDAAAEVSKDREVKVLNLLRMTKGMSFAAARKYINDQVTQGSLDKNTAKKVLAKLSQPAPTMEGDPPPNDSLRSPMSEGTKPDFPDIDDDGNKKEPISKAAKDAEKKPKKKVSESVHKHNAARLLGKHHALAKEAYNCKYDDMEESRLYHEGYKEGLDECYGQMPVQGLVSENPMPATVPGMASASMPPAMEEDMFDEGNAFTNFLATHDKGETGTVGGRTVTDTSSYDADVDESFMAFESWDKELNALLHEGMTVSISKGQQGMPDSVSVSAQDAEADQLLGLIKQAGMGLFGGEDKPQGFAADVTGMSAGGEEEGRDSGDIGVVDDHDGMMALIKKVVGGHQEPEEVGSGSDEGHDYEGEDGEEEHDHEGHDHDDEEVNEAQCNECGMMESNCECDSESVDEDESYNQEEEEVAEDNAPDSGAAETTADENAEAAEDSALAKADELKEWANEAGKKGTDESFETDINFITRVLAGGLNKEKSTGQTTVPVIAGQNDRMGYSVKNESISDWKKLAGLK